MGLKLSQGSLNMGERCRKSVSECCEVRKTLPFTAGFRDEKDLELRNTGSLQTLEKVRKLVLHFQKGTQLGRHLDSSPLRPVLTSSHPSTNQALPCLTSEISWDWVCLGWYGCRLTSDLLHYKIINLCCVKPLYSMENFVKRLQGTELGL